MPNSRLEFQCVHKDCTGNFKTSTSLRLHKLFCPHIQSESTAVYQQYCDYDNDSVLRKLYSQLLDLFGMAQMKNHEPDDPKFSYKSSKLDLICQLVDCLMIIKDRTDNSFLSKFFVLLNDYYRATSKDSDFRSLSNIDQDLESFFTSSTSLSVSSTNHSIMSSSLCSATQNRIEFKKHTVHEGSFRFTYYSVDPVELLKNQVSTVTMDQIIMDPDSCADEWNAVTSKLGKDVIPKFISLIKSHSSTDIK